MFLSRYFDRLAIALSTICIVHCLALPLVVAVAPIAAFATDTDSHFHALLLWLVVPTSVFGFGLGYRVHRHSGLIVVGAAGVATLAVVALYGHSVWSPQTEAVVSVVASVALAAAHWRNFREVRRLHRHI
jgi:hypothetical protein